MIKYLLFLFCTTLSAYDLAVCAVFQNEDFFLREWLEFHKIVGVQHFYLYNNLSTDRSLEILQPYIDKGEVELFDWPIPLRNQAEYVTLLQLPVFNDCLHRARDHAKWVAFIDLDEFLFPLEADNLVDFLSDYEQFGGVVVNWQIYGTSFVDKLPIDALITETLIWKAPEQWEINKYIKQIVQPKYATHALTPHSFAYLDGFFAVNSNAEKIQEKVDGMTAVIDRIRINHYWFGTEEWLRKNKLPRRAKWGMNFAEDILQSIITTSNATIDRSIFRFIPTLREILLIE